MNRPGSAARRWLGARWHRLLVHGGALTPLVALAVGYLRDDLGATPNRALILRTGSIGLILLVAALACTPLSALTGWRRIVQVRRPLGVYGFIYAALHLLIYAALDNGFDPALIRRDLGERRSMRVGLAALLALAPLAATSTRGWQRRLGRGWPRLHRLVYLAVPLSVLHYLWLDRDIITAPLIYAGMVGVLLALPLPPLRRALGRARRLLPAPAATPRRPRR